MLLLSAMVIVVLYYGVRESKDRKRGQFCQRLRKEYTDKHTHVPESGGPK